jgi:hypothetical protein
MFGTLPAASFNASSSSSSSRTVGGSGGGKAASQVPSDWVDQVQLLQTNQSMSRVICLSGYLVDYLPGEKFNSDNGTLVIVVPLSIAIEFFSKWFPKLTSVPLADLDVELTKMPFKFPVRMFDPDHVQFSIKIHKNLFKESFPEGIEQGVHKAVNMCIQIFVYSIFGTLTTPGCSLKCGWIQFA